MKYAELDLPAEWIRYQERTGWNSRKSMFLRSLREKITNPQVVDERLRWCSNCDNPHDLNMVDGTEQPYCPACWAQAAACNHCGRTVMALYNVIHGARVCQSCRDAYYVYCRTCALHYPHGEGNQHMHGADGCCTSPATEFTVPHPGHGDGVLANDTITTVEFEAGLISPRSIRGVVQFLSAVAQQYGNPYEPGSRAKKMYDLAVALNRNNDLVGRQERNPEGTFVTRLKRHAYKECSLKLDPDILTQVGNLVSTKTKGQSYNIAFTRELNLPPAEFGHPGSCWWTEYKDSRCALKTNGGMAMRAFDDGERVLGRAWVMPLKVGVDGNLAPTFDAHSGIYFAFNGYGTLSEEYHRVLAEVVGAEHTVNVSFEAERYYVNSGAGKLLGPADVVKPWGGGTITMPLTAHSDLFQVETNPTFGSAKGSVKERVHVEAF